MDKLLQEYHELDIAIEYCEKAIEIMKKRQKEIENAE